MSLKINKKVKVKLLHAKKERVLYELTVFIFISFSLQTIKIIVCLVLLHFLFVLKECYLFICIAQFKVKNASALIGKDSVSANCLALCFLLLYSTYMGRNKRLIRRLFFKL